MRTSWTQSSIVILEPPERLRLDWVATTNRAGWLATNISGMSVVIQSTD